MSVHPIDYLVHFSNILLLVSYSVRNILWLRWFAVGAALTNMPYFLFQPTVLWPPILWAGVFTAINLYQIWRIYMERRPVALSPDEQTLYDMGFRSLTPRDFAVELTLRAQAQDPSGAILEGTWYGLVPVVPGAAWATIEGRSLVVRSPVPRTMAYVDLVAGGKVVQSLNLELHEENGVPTARWPFTSRLTPETFAVVSSEPDLQSMALVGWPLHPHPEWAQPTATWDARSRLVIDGVAQRRVEVAASRQTLRRQVFAAMGAGVFTELVLFAVLLRQIQRTEAPSSQTTRLWIWMVLFAVAAGLLSLSFVAS